MSTTPMRTTPMNATPTMLQDPAAGHGPAGRRRRRLVVGVLVVAGLVVAGAAGAVVPVVEPPAAGPDGVQLLGEPMSYRFAGRIHERVDAVWDVVNTSAAPVEVDGVFRADPGSERILGDAVDVFYGFPTSSNPPSGSTAAAGASAAGPQTAADDGVVWVAAGSLSAPVSVQDACQRAGADCSGVVAAHGRDRVRVQVLLERPELLTADTSLDATFYLQYVPTQ